MMKAAVCFVKRNGAKGVWIRDVRKFPLMRSTSGGMVSSENASLPMPGIPNPA
jgi:hypothetical protein